MTGFLTGDQCHNRLANASTAATNQTAGTLDGTGIVKPATVGCWVLKNMSGADAYVSPSSGVTSANGFILEDRGTLRGSYSGALYGTPVAAFCYYLEA